MAKKTRGATKPALNAFVTRTKASITFRADDNAHDRFTVERNVGQLSFQDAEPGDVVCFDAHDGEGGWYMDADDALTLYAWFGDLVSDILAEQDRRQKAARR